MKRLTLVAGLLLLPILSTAQTVGVVDIAKGWKFRPDPENIGVQQTWFAATLSDKDWTEIDGGRPWEKQGFDGYDGVAWYRKAVATPARAKGEFWIVLGGVGGAYEVYVNGRLVQSVDEEAADNQVMIPLKNRMRGKSTVLAIRVSNSSGEGGLKRYPIVLTSVAPKLFGHTFSMKTLPWKFHLEQQNEGASGEWFRSDLSESGWSSISVGELWETQGYPYDGYAWYRVRFRLPAFWGTERIYLVFGGVDDIYDVYVNGEKVGSHGSIEKKITVYTTVTVTDVTDHVRRDQDNTLAVRVYDWGGGGGIWKDPIALMSNREMAISPSDYVREYAKQHGDLAMPYWAQGKGVSWTMVGMEGGREEVLRSFDGSVGSTAWPFAVTSWLLEKGKTSVDVRAPERIEPNQNETMLERLYLPLSVFRTKYGPVKVESRLFVWTEGDVDGDAVAYYQVTVMNDGALDWNGDYVFAVRPYLVNGTTGRLNSLTYDAQQLMLVANDSLVILPDEKPTHFLGSSLSLTGDVSQHLRKQIVPTGGVSWDHRGLATGAISYRMKLRSNERKTYSFRIPLKGNQPLEKIHSIRAGTVEEMKQSAMKYWDNRLRQVRLILPDEEYANAYYASLAYILISMDKRNLHPGPLAYNAFWYRDGAYQVQALLASGFGQVTAQTIEIFMGAQLSTGEFPSIFDLNLKPLGPHEWDAQGQGIFALAQYYRYTKDIDVVRKHWEKIVKAADFIKSLRAQRLKPEYRGLPVYGILPPSESAEDLGSGEWHHYWDDFWCIKGLRDAAYLARELGNARRAKEFEAEASELMKWTRTSFLQVMETEGIDWIPNGPEDTQSSSMARGTGPGLWPGQSLRPEDPIVLRSFDRYYEKWIKPFGGAYLHHSSFWPYGFELALCYVMLNRREVAHEMIRWHLNHQSFSNAYAWAEQIDTTTHRFRAGDMPHCWVAADYVNLLRGLLLYETEDQIVLGAGIPKSWLETGKQIAVDRAPTVFGEIGYSIDWGQKEKQLVVQLFGKARPPAGFLLKLPYDLEEIASATADGKKISPDESGALQLAGETRMVTLELR